MATKLQIYAELADQTLQDLTAKRGGWTQFLDTAAWMYKYPFHDQLMIYAQRPDATACAELELWNEKFSRWVRRGSKGIALIDDSGNYPRLKYVFDVSDTEATLHHARPVQLWEMRQEHKAAVLAELARNYEDIDDDHSIAETIHNIAKQLATEYYEDNRCDILLRSENSVLEPTAHYDFAGSSIDEADDTSLRAVFEAMLANSVAYTVMARAGFDPGEYFDEDDFGSIVEFNTPDIANALGVASSDLSEQVLRDIEITIRKFERAKSAERSEHEHDSNLHASRGLSSSGHQAERAAQRVGDASGQIREDEESLSERTQTDSVQPHASVGEAVPAPAGSGRSGEPPTGTGDGTVNNAYDPAGQDGSDELDGGDELAESTGGGIGAERTDLQLNGNETQEVISAEGAAEEAAPFSMAELARYHSDWNGYVKNGILNDETVINGAINSDRQNTVTEINNSLKRLQLSLSQDILNSAAITHKGALVNELYSYFNKDRQPPLAEQLYDTVIQSDEYKERSLIDETPPTYSQVGNTVPDISDILSSSPVTPDEFDVILRDGGNDAGSVLRITAHFAKGKDDNVEFLKQEYLSGRYDHREKDTGKGFKFDSHSVCAWFDEDGISLAIGTTAKNNIHSATVPWEAAAARINEMMLTGQFVSREMFDKAIDNEFDELAGELWDFYRDDMGYMPEEWQAHEGGYPGDHALIKSLLEDENSRQSIHDRLEGDIASYDPAQHGRRWHDRHRLLAKMKDAMLPPVIFPDDNYSDNKNFTYFITQDEIDAYLTRGSNVSESKFRFLSFFLGNHDSKEKLEFVKSEYGHGGGTWTDTNGWYGAEPGKGVTLQRGGIGNPDAEVNLKWNAVIKRTEQLIFDGRYMSRAELDRIPNYEKLMLMRQVKNFYHDLPEEYDDPFGELDFHYPKEAEWNVIHTFLEDYDQIDSALEQMRYIYENTSTEDRYYNIRKGAFEQLSAFREGTYTLFPGLENLPDPETAAFRRIEPPPRRERIEDLREPSEYTNFGETISGEQISLFDASLPILPSVEEQQAKIEQKEPQQSQTAEAEKETSAVSLSDDSDNIFLNISSEDKARIYAQFADNPRSREAVNLVREIYGDMLTMPIPQAIKGLAELVDAGDFDTEQALTKLYLNRVGAFYEIVGDEAAEVAEILDLTLTERSNIPMIGFPDNMLESYADKLSEAGFEILIREADEPEIVPEPEPPDLDEIKQRVYDRIMADEAYAGRLSAAESRGALRTPLNTALDKVIEELQSEVPGGYFNDNISDELFDFVYRQSWENRPVQEAPAVETVPEQGNFFEDQSPSKEILPSVPEEPKPPAKPLIPAKNFRITDDHLGEGGAKTKFRYNMDAIYTLQNIELEKRNATPEEQEKLSRYVGWGGLPQAFDPDNKQWENEYLELNAALSPEEFASARGSTLNAHYTSPVVIKAMWEAVEQMGFKKGNILEPSCGVGNFFGLIPKDLQQSKLYGVELDDITARIAKHLYPTADIRSMGFEKTDFPDAFFDLAVGNVPFGDYGVVDKRYDKHNFHIHNYFFAKALDKVRPGGIVAFITSKYTMDEKKPTVRKYLAERAELLGAVRLPNTTFLKNAGTETTMDILFLQKRDRPIDIMPDWVHLGVTKNGIPCNRYFIDNSEMLCGVMGLDEHMNNKYGRNDMTACLPIEGADLSEQLKTAISHIHGQFTLDELDDLDGVDNHAIPADSHVKNFSYALITPGAEPDNADGNIYAAKIGEWKVYFRENSLMYPVDLPMMTLERIKGMIGLRDCVQKLIALQLDESSDDEIKAQQAELNTLYDSFIAEFGLISSQANSRAFNADSSYYLLASLEILDENGDLERKADMFTKRTIKQKTAVTHVDTASEALAVSIGERARVDLEYMSELTGFDREKLLADLRGVIFLNIGSADGQENTYVTADEYLSGNVREKLKLAEAAAKVDPTLQVNVDALKAIQPKDLEAGEISVRLGSTWIEPEYVQQFMHELLNTSWRNKEIYQVKYHKITGEWQVTGKNKAQYSDINATVTYGTSRMNAYQIIDDTLNLRDVRVYDYKRDADGKERRVLNKKETMLAQQKQELIKQKFRDWIWQDPERRQTLVRKYNDLFNSVRPREYDGSHITFSGINPEIKLSKHQVDGAARILYGGNTLLAHVVGAGKTFTMIAAAQESKRLGLCQKSLFAVPNHLTEQWAAEYLRLYPSANILVATKKDFEMRNRKKFCAKIATGDYDAVIIGHTQLEKIPMSRERQERQIRNQIDEIQIGIMDLKAAKGEQTSIKQLEKTKRKLEARLVKLLNSKKRDDVVTFEELGVDRLYVDEAHNFKNLFLYTKMRNVAGLSTTEAQKSSDLFMKCRYLDEITGSRGTIFATGTPISNSMSEMYTMQRYLEYEMLSSKYLTHFDAWASIFGETVTSIELAPEGTGYRARTRFARFHNLPELMCMFKQVADIQTADMLNLPVPEAKYENIIVEPSEIQQDMVQELSERAAKVHTGNVDPKTDNMLKITTDGRKIGLDQRLINPLLPDYEGSKANVCTDIVYNIWDDTKPKRLTQIIFCDFSTPNKDGRFNVYDDIREKLLERGIPESEIAFIHDADTETRKKELFAKVRQGKVRILFGSTFKCGAGTNVQDRLVAIHDVDCPWRPADLEQRSGRIIRQGNQNDEVQIYRYATSGTFDSYLWQTVQKKQEFIAQIMSSKSPVRSCEDCDETALSYAEIKALCAGNPLIAEKMNLDNEVAKLRMLKSEHQSQHYRLEDDLLKRFPEQIADVTERIAGIEKDIAKYAAEKEKCVEAEESDGSASVATKFPGMTINGVEYIEKEPAAKALLDSCKDIKGKSSDLAVGEYMGFKLSLRYENFGQQIGLLMRGTMTYQISLGIDALGNISRINHALDKLPERLEGAKSQLDNINTQIEAAKLELTKPFEQENELQEKEARLALLNADLNIDDPSRAGSNSDMDVLNDNDDRGRADDYSEDESDEEDLEDDFSYMPDRVPQAAYAKAKPSILDGIRSFSSEKSGDIPGDAKLSELDI